METLIAPLFASEIIAQDAAYIWHPYSRSASKPPLPIAGASGAYYIGVDGRRYFDAISSWWVNIHGHCHPYIANCIAEQVQTLEQILFTDFTHSAAVELAARLVFLLEIGKGRVFFSDNGSTSVETAIKIALQYWLNKKQSTAKTKIISFQNAYHGDTFGSMSVSARSIFNRPFWPYLFEIKTISPPYKDAEDLSIKQMKKILDQGDVAAFIFEPTLQGAAGMVPHSAQGLETLIDLCQQNNVITIADEVMTGFGRTGPLFASNPMRTKPDITCLSKGLTGGFLPLGATVVKEYIYDTFHEETSHAFLHGHSYSGNAIGCAAALASLDLLCDPSCSLARKNIGDHHTSFQKTWGSHEKLQRCSVTGTVLAVEYRDPEGKRCNYLSPLRNRLMERFLANDIIVRPLGNLLYIIPPYCTTNDELEKIYACIQDTLEKD